jgi:hypothetical protein
VCVCVCVCVYICIVKVKISRGAEVALGVPGRLKPWIFSTFGTTRVVGRQPNAPAAFTPGEIPGTHLYIHVSIAMLTCKHTSEHISFISTVYT